MTLPDTPTLTLVKDLLYKILPKHKFYINHLMRRLVIDKTSPTMGVGKDNILYINLDFWKEFKEDLDSIGFALYHELMHIVAYDYRYLNDKMSKHRRMLTHLAMDSRINAFCLAGRLATASTKKEFPEIPKVLVDNGYKEENEGWMFGEVISLTQPDPAKVCPKLQHIHARIYRELYPSKHWGSPLKGFRSIVRELLEIYPEPPVVEMEISIKAPGGSGGGDSSDSGGEDGEGDIVKIRIEIEEGYLRDTERLSSLSEEAMQTLIHLAEEAYKKLSDGPGHSDQHQNVLAPDTTYVPDVLDPEIFRVVSKEALLQNIRVHLFKPKVKWRKGICPSIPLNKRDVSYAMAGRVPAYWNRLGRGPSPVKALAPIYLDVSDSTYPFIKAILQMLLDLEEHIESVWGFSDYVAEHTREDLAANRLDTSGGTDFTPVIQHAMDNGHDNIVVITDGQAYCNVPVDVSTSFFEKVFVVLFGDHAWTKNYLSDLPCAETIPLTKLS